MHTRASWKCACMGFTLFTDSEVRHVCCDYIMHYSSAYVTMLEGNLVCPKHRKAR